MYQLSRLAKIPGLIHGFSTMENGSQGFGFGPKGKVIRNRSAFVRNLSGTFHIRGGIAMVPLQPGYEETISVVGEGDAGWGMTEPFSLLTERTKPLAKACEAMILPWQRERTRSVSSEFATEPEAFPDWADAYLFLAVADCIPIIVYHPHEDPAKRVLALIHGSRESTVRKVALKTVRYMEEHFGARPEDMVAGLGPGIRTYELDWFDQANDPEWQEFCRIGDNGKILVDLFGFNVHLLKSAGVPEDRIEAYPFDTLTDKRFYSHRRSELTGEPEGRHAVAVGMVPLE